MLGNPPYSSFGRMNRASWILSLLDDYKKGLNEKKLNLDDDFIKFIRFAQWRIDKTGEGIVGFITNNSYLDGITHRRMREFLLGSFTDVYILNLHGSTKKKESAPGGTRDENVFDITIGVCITLFVKRSNQNQNTGCKVYYADLWGGRVEKYAFLSKSDVALTKWTELKPERPHYYFVPKDFRSQKEYEIFYPLTEIFSVHQNGLKTDRDDLFFDFDRQTLIERMKTFYSSDCPADFKSKYRITASSSYNIEARRAVTKYSEDNIRLCLYRPFDLRWLYYDAKLTSRPAYDVMKHMLLENLAMITTRQTAERFDVLCANTLAGHKSVAAYDINTMFPLYLRNETICSPLLRKSISRRHF